MPLWRIELFGSLRLVHPNRTVVRFRTEKTGGVLGYLAYHLPCALTRDVLAEQFWPHAHSDAAHQSLRTALSSLRRQLEPPGVAPRTVLLANRLAVGLNPEAVTTDVAEFHAEIAAARHCDDPVRRVEHLARAMDLYRGPLLADSFDEWVPPEREHLAQTMLWALTGLLRHYHQAGDLRTALEIATRAATVAPQREEVHRNVMRLHAQAGNATDALRHYANVERILQRELGTPPDAQTRALADRIRRGDLAGIGPAPEEDAPAPAAPHAAPPAFPVTTFLLADAGEDRPELRDALCREAARHGGQILAPGPAPFSAAFARPADALRAALAAAEIAAADTGPPGPRLALHTAEAAAESALSGASALSHAARLLSAAHPGQALVSEAAAALARHTLPEGAGLRDLGLYRLNAGLQPERLFQLQFGALGAAEFAPPMADPVCPSNIPAQLTRLFGREREADHLCRLIAPAMPLPAESPRLVTLTGAGGSGKTRLAIHAAARLQDLFGGRVWFVPLAEIHEGRLVGHAIAGALGLDPERGSDPLPRIADALAGQPALLILDNCEQLLPDMGAFVAELLRRAPLVSALATSRRPLAVPGERLFAVPPLPVPAGPCAPNALLLCPSVQLFVDRAQAVLADFQVTHRNAAAVAELCARLEGIPLALELVAARAALLTPAHMLQRLGERLDWGSTQRPASERHRTLRAALDWSHDLLSLEQQQLFARLSLFRGGWTAEAAGATCLPEAPESAPERLAQLQDNSLILVDPEGEEMRWRMLETIRDYAAEKLTEWGDAPDQEIERHAAFFLRFAQDRIAELRTPLDVSAIERLDAELGNLRGALEGSLAAGRNLQGARLALVTGTFLWRRGLLSEAWHCLCQGEDALSAAAGAPEALHAAMQLLRARLEIDRLDCAAAARSAGEARSLLSRLGDRRGEADAVNLLGLAARGAGCFDEAREHFGRAIEWFREAGDASGLAAVLTNLGLVENEAAGGDRDAASRYWREALGLRRQQGDRRGTAEVLTDLGILAQEQQRPDEAEGCYRDALRIELELGHTLGVARALCNLGEVAEMKGDAVRAARLLVAAEFLFANSGSPHVHYVARQVERVAGACEDAAAIADAFRATACQWSTHDLADWALGRQAAYFSPQNS